MFFILAFHFSLHFTHSKHSLCVNISDQPTLRCFELHKDVNLGFYISCLFKKNSVAFYGKKKRNLLNFKSTTLTRKAIVLLFLGCIIILEVFSLHSFLLHGFSERQPLA